MTATDRLALTEELFARDAAAMPELITGILNEIKAAPTREGRMWTRVPVNLLARIEGALNRQASALASERAESAGLLSMVVQAQVAYQEQIGVTEYWQDGANAASDECIAMAARALVAEAVIRAAQDAETFEEAYEELSKVRTDLLDVHDAQVKAEALEEAADEMLEVPGGREQHVPWLHARAAGIRKAAQSGD